jgi:putative hydrolase of the HAD superfamily
MRYESVIFDLYGTLVDILTDESPLKFWQSVANLYKVKGANYTAEEFRDGYFKAINAQRINQDEFFEPDLYKVFSDLFIQKGVVVARPVIKEIAINFRKLSTVKLELYDGVIEQLTRLKECGARVYLLSNAQALFTIYELKLLGLYKLFDDIFISSDWAVSKPSVRFFELPIKKHRLSKDKTVMVGNDGVCDILGAKAIGLDTIYFKTQTSPNVESVQATYAFEGCQIEKAVDIILS